jgi:tetratricopeptide (TPR) repeat protein
MGKALGHLGNATADAGDLPGAIEYFEQARKVFAACGNRHGESSALRNLSLAYDGVGDRERAIAYAETTLTLFEQMGSPGAAKVRKTLEEWQRGDICA